MLKHFTLKRVILILAIVIFGGVFFFVVQPNNSSAEQPISHNGYLDLSNWDFEKDGKVKLDGEWEFYWNKLLTPEDFKTQKEGSYDGYIKVPSAWKGSVGEAVLSDRGAATYRLKVHLKDNQALLGIKTTSIRMSSRIFVDGVEVLSSGIPALTKAGYTLANTPYFATVSPKSRDVEIIVQVADFDYKAGGIVQSIHLGEYQDIFTFSVRNNFINGFLAQSLFITSLYYLFVFIGRRRDLSLLYYSMYALTFSLFEVLYGEKILLQMSLYLSNHYSIMIKVSDILIYLSIIFVSLFVGKIAKKVIPQWFIKGILIIFGALSVMIAALPFSVASRFENIGLLLGMAAYLFIIAALLSAIIRKEYGEIGRSELIRLAFAYACVFIFFADGILYINNIRHDTYLGHLAMIVFIANIFMLLSQQFNKSFNTIEKMNIKLLEVDRLKDEFLANTSHEIRTPLNGIINLTQSVIDHAKDRLEQHQQEDLKLVISAGRRLSNLINDILDMSSLKRGEIKLVIKSVDVRSVASVILHVMDHLKDDKKIVFINSIPENLPPAAADEERLRQIYYNLIGNALKFTQSGAIEVGGRVLNGMIELWVKDTGCGIPLDQQEDIFKPFVQSESPENAENQGTGLGLSITRQLIELNGGKISVVSAPGEGSKFNFTLPISKETAKKAATASFEYANPEEEPIPGGNFIPEKDSVSKYAHNIEKQQLPEENKRGDKYRILAADDDPTNLRALLAMLDSPDYYIKAVSDGQQAWEELLKQPNYDLVILDVMMPKLTGYQVLGKIRERFSNVELPVILLTAKARQQDIKTGFELGANDYLPKPFEAEELKSRVSTLVQMKKTVNSLVSAELNFLQAQIKPHFLYNALSVIASLTSREPDKAKALLLNLSDYLRGSFNFENQNGLVTLSSELQTVEAYLEIEKARFKKRLKVEFDIDSEILITIPMLSLQPLVENAVRHGIMGKVEGGTVKVSVRSTENHVIITVEDDGVGIPEKKLAELLKQDGAKGVGIKNIHKRMLALYGKGLQIESAPGLGTKVTMSIPLNTIYEAV